MFYIVVLSIMIYFSIREVNRCKKENKTDKNTVQIDDFEDCFTTVVMIHQNLKNYKQIEPDDEDEYIELLKNMAVI